MAFRFKWNDSELGRNIEKMESKLMAVANIYADSISHKLQTYMKLNRPWTDRTGMAKALLKSEVSHPEKNIIRITLSHGVEYGVYLELSNFKKYAIILPTIMLLGPKILDDFKDLMSDLKV